MVCDKIQVGSVIKNYKTMCELLQENYKKTHDKRKRQEDEWHRYFNWIRDGNKFIITELYDIPSPPIVTQGKGKYINYFGYILLNILKENNGEILLFKNQLMERMRMKSRPYIEYAKNNPYYDEVAIVNNAINKIFDACLIQMEHKGYIRVEKVREFIKTSDDTGKTIFEKLSEEDILTYEQLEDEALSIYALENDRRTGRISKRDISMHGDWFGYYRILNPLVDEVFNCNIRVRLKIELVVYAVYDVNPDTVYDDLNNAICQRLINISDKMKASNKTGWNDIIYLSELNCTTYEGYEEKICNTDILYEIFYDDNDCEYPVSVAAFA